MFCRFTFCPKHVIIYNVRSNKTILEENKMKKTVHIVIEGGCVVEAYADCDVDVVVYDLDTQDTDMKDEIEKAVAQLADFAHEVEIL
jgi:hypothetical protein